MLADPGRLKAVFLAAAQRKTPADRDAYLVEACGDDRELRGRIEGLLRAHEGSGGWLGDPFPVPDEKTDSLRANDTLTHEPLTRTLDFPGAGPGTIIASRYLLVRLLGRGGMGQVWLAEQIEPFRRHVALKIIGPGVDSARVLALFKKEQQALALMDHPHIAKVYDAGTTPEGLPFFVMELVEGTHLTHYCDDHKLAVRARLELFVQICAAVQHAHQKMVIHRDLKPSNILVAEHDGRPVPKVIDFGLAKALQPHGLGEQTLATGSPVAGTLLYMAPEQAAGAEDVDTRADIYALGVILYELLTGTTPLERECFEGSWLEFFPLIREVEPPKPSARLAALASRPAAAAPRLPSTPQLATRGGQRDLDRLAATMLEKDRERILKMIRETELSEPRAQPPTWMALSDVAARRGAEPVKLIRAVRGDLDWIVMNALEKDRDRRYGTAAALAQDVQRHLRDEPVEIVPPSPAYKLRKFTRRNRRKVFAGALLLVTLLGGIAATTWQAVRATRAADEREKAREDALAARKDARDKLWRSLRDQARVAQSSRQLGQHFVSLKNLAEAAAIAHELGVPAEELLSLRNHAIAAIALPADLEPGREWLVPNAWSRELAFDPALAHYAVDEGNHLGIYSVADTAEVTRLPRADSSRVAVKLSFSPNGRYLLVMELDDPSQQWVGIRIWDWREGKERFARVRTLNDDREGFGWSEWSPDSERFTVFHVNSRSVRVYELATGRETLRLETGPGVQSVALRPGGGELALTIGKEVRLYDEASGKLTDTLRHPQSLVQLRWRADGRLLAVVCGQDRYVWDPSDPAQPLATLKGHERGGGDIGFAPSGDLLMTSSYDATVRFWDSHTGRELLTAPGLHVAPSRLSDDGTLAVKLGGDRVGLMHLPRGGEMRTIRGLPAGLDLRAVDVHPNGRLAVTAAMDGISLWDLKHSRELGRIPGQGARFHPNGSHLLVTGPDGLVEWPVRFDATHVVHIGPPRQIFSQNLGIHRYLGGQVRLDREGRRAVAVAGPLGQALVIDLSKDRPERVALRHPDICFAAISPDGRWVVTADWGQADDATIRVWNADTGEAVVDRLHSRRSGIAFSPDGRWLVAGDAEAFRFFHVGTWEPAPERTIPRAGDDPFSVGLVAFSPDGRLLAVNHSHRDARLYDADTLEPVSTLAGGDALMIASLAFSADGGSLLVGRENKTLHVWDLRAVRSRLAGMGLDWAHPPLPAAEEFGGPEPLVARVYVGPTKPGEGWQPPKASLAQLQARLVAYSLLCAQTPYHPEPFHWRGHLHQYEGRDAEAIADFTEALRWESRVERRAHLFDVRAESHLRLGHTVDAVADCLASAAEALRRPTRKEVEGPKERAGTEAKKASK
jgi:serine/threonine protein kinase/WD40 repeat protein